MSQQEVECTLHIEQIVHQPCHLNNVAELLVSCQSADGNEPHVKQSGYSVLECIWLPEKERGKRRNKIQEVGKRERDKQKCLIN